jgi:hypothetical protein
MEPTDSATDPRDEAGAGRETEASERAPSDGGGRGPTTPADELLEHETDRAAEGPITESRSEDSRS